MKFKFNWFMKGMVLVFLLNGLSLSMASLHQGTTRGMTWALVHEGAAFDAVPVVINLLVWVVLQTVVFATVLFFIVRHLIPSPLGLGKLELADGSWVTSFVREGYALDTADDATTFGGWRAYMDSLPRQFLALFSLTRNSRKHYD